VKANNNFKIEQLSTPRLWLREITENDADDIFNIFSNYNLIKFTDNEIHKTKNDSLTWIHTITEKYYRKKLVYWGISLKGTENIIGVAGIYHIDFKHDFASSKVILGYDFHNKGYMTEAMKAIIDFIFNVIQLNRIEAQVFVDNKPALRQFEKLGFEMEGVLKQNFLIENFYKDSALLALLKCNYLEI